MRASAEAHENGGAGGSPRQSYMSLAHVMPPSPIIKHLFGTCRLKRRSGGLQLRWTMIRTSFGASTSCVT
eukprot:jgi/Botrbrau1/4518/Bobra.60_2s0009.1